MALALVAALSVTGQALVQSALTRHAQDARLINIAGRQRMLSQRVTKAALALARPLPATTAATATTAAARVHHDELLAALGEWTHIHQSLARGEGATALEPSGSAAIGVMLPRIERSFVAMVAAAQAALRAADGGDQAALDRSVALLLALEPAFLDGMDDIVNQFQRETDGRVTGVRLAELALLGLILLTLVFEGLLVFRPAVTRIHHSWAQHRRMEREMLDIGERERERIGQDIHDDLCQQLAGIRFLSESLAVRAARGAAITAPELEEVAQLGQRALAVASAVARGLYITALADGGLPGALADLAASTAARQPVCCTHDLRAPGARDLAHDVAVQLYRIAQEALANAVKHAGATGVHVALWPEGSALVMTITDDGVGVPAAGDRRHGMGMHIMRNRARTIGATLQIERAGGTRVTCRLGGAL